MMIAKVILCVFTIVFCSVNAINCPQNYEDGNNDACYRVYATPSNRAQAVASCGRDGAQLADVTNAFVNSQIVTLGKAVNVEKIWLGYTCVSNTYTECKLFDGTAFGVNTYERFYPGEPVIAAGKYVYMDTSGKTSGWWFSASEAPENQYGFACEYTGAAPATCGVGYSEFNGFCYKALNDQLTEAQAEYECTTDCGHITSITSAEENTFVLNVGKTTAQAFTRIGLLYNGTNHFIWTDGTPFDPTAYTNSGHVDTEIGSCFALALTDAVIPTGEWISTDCTKPMTAVCKKAKTSPCVPDTTGSPTMSPITCTSTYFYDGNGTLYSPGYPLRYEKNTCKYVISVPRGYLATIQFPEFLLDANSEVKLYNDLIDVTPFITLSGTVFVNPLQVFVSNESEMKVEFISSNGAPNDKEYRWKAVHGAQLASQYSTALPGTSSGCNEGLRLAPATITSPYYPEDYPNFCDCGYLLGSSNGQRVVLHFNHFNTESSVDVLVVYDGQDANAPVLARLSGTNPATQNYTSSGSRMFLKFTTDSSNVGAFDGFQANFNNYS